MLQVYSNGDIMEEPNERNTQNEACQEWHDKNSRRQVKSMNVTCDTKMPQQTTQCVFSRFSACVGVLFNS